LNRSTLPSTALPPALAAVAAAVVGQDLVDDDAAGGEPDLGSGQEARGGLAGLIRVDLGIGQPRMIVDGGVDETVADQRVVMAAALAS
jgi:hypothetical protein